MPKIETVITALAICTGKCKCFGCWYGRNNPDFRCQDRLMEDALALLREQEPVAPTKDDDGDMFCGNCGETVGLEELNCGGISMVKYEYCPHCGRRVKWDETHAVV